VPRFEDLALEGLAAADDIAHPLLGFARDADCRQLAGAIEPRQVGRVELVVLPLDSGPFGDERRRDHVAGIPPLDEGAVQHVPGAARFVAGPEFAVPGNAIEPALEFRQIVRESIEPGRGLGVLGQHGNRD
jgi:hypothetical protein